MKHLFSSMYELQNKIFFLVIHDYYELVKDQINACIIECIQAMYNNTGRHHTDLPLYTRDENCFPTKSALQDLKFNHFEIIFPQHSVTKRFVKWLFCNGFSVTILQKGVTKCYNYNPFY